MRRKRTMKFDAIMLCSYGGPRGMDDVLPFMRNATRGRGVPDERLQAVSVHYKMFDGISPINARNEELRKRLAQELQIPVVIGNRNWTPYFTDTLKQLDEQGLHRVLCIFTAAFASYSGCRQYREDLAGALASIGATERFQLSRLPAYYDSLGFLQANLKSAAIALEKDPQAHLLLVTHSIPVAMNENSGPNIAALTYLNQHRTLGTKLCTALSELLNREIEVDLAFCSRSGSPHQKWLEPDINDRLVELAQAGETSVVALPLGFINDHMEVVYDLDTEAAQTAKNLGLRYQRAATAGTDPDFIDSLLALIRGEFRIDTWPEKCSADCCLPRKDYQPLPAAFQSNSANRTLPTESAS